MTPQPALIVTAAERLLVEVERAVSRFPRAHRYALGQDLRRWACDGVIAAQSAWRARQQRPQQLEQLQALISVNDRLKLGLQVAHRLQCFTSAGAFQALGALAVSVGRQAGGWRKQVLLDRGDDDGLEQDAESRTRRRDAWRHGWLGTDGIVCLQRALCAAGSSEQPTPVQLWLHGARNAPRYGERCMPDDCLRTCNCTLGENRIPATTV